MIADHLTDIEKFDADLWKMADDLRANSGLASNEYFMPIMGLLFLRQATNRYYEALAAIEADKATGKMPDRPLRDADFTRRRAMMLPEAARYDVILDQPKDGKLGEALTAAMEAVAEHFPPLAGQLPTDYEKFDDELLESMMRKFDTEALARSAARVRPVDRRAGPLSTLGDGGGLGAPCQRVERGPRRRLQAIRTIAGTVRCACRRNCRGYRS